LANSITVPPIVRSLRSLRLPDFLADRFGRDVRPGKGSEISVYSEGGRIFTLGRHRRHNEVSLLIVKQLRKRLMISPHEWLEAVYG